MPFNIGSRSFIPLPNLYRIFFSIINSLYSLIWDIRFDWDLGYSGAKHRFLRDRITLQFASIPFIHKQHVSTDNIALQARSLDDFADFGNPYIYYTIIVLNTLIRFAWVLPNAMKYYNFHVWPGLLVFTLQLLEIFRRWLWVFIRCEKQAIQTKRISMYFLK